MPRSLPDEYMTLLDGEQIAPSWLMALLPPDFPFPDVTRMLKRLRGISVPLSDIRPAHKRTIPDARWELEMTLGQAAQQDEQHSRELRLWTVPSEGLDEYHLNSIPLSKEEKDAIKRSKWSVGLSEWFDDKPLESFHHQLKLLSELFPESAIFYDAGAYRAYSSIWTRDAADAHTPPPLSTLFAVHTVLPEDKHRGGAWLHTHGLLRCGYPELEMLDVDLDSVDVCGQIMNVVAALILDRGMPEPMESFWPGVDIELVWLPLHDALSRVGRKCVGHLDERDELHTFPSAVLFAPKRRFFFRKLYSPSIYRGLLDGDPLLFFPDSETERMSALAKERLERFSELFELLRDKEGWLFVVKLGYKTDEAEDEKDREHMWFEVLELGEAECKAKLLNEPFRIQSMSEGQVGVHDLSLLSDWQIVCPLGTFSADTVVHLQRLMEAAGLQEPAVT